MKWVARVIRLSNAFVLCCAFPQVLDRDAMPSLFALVSRHKAATTGAGHAARSELLFELCVDQ